MAGKVTLATILAPRPPLSLLPRYLWSPDLSVIASADASLSTPSTAVCWILSQAVVGAKGRGGVLYGDKFLFVCLFSQGAIGAKTCWWGRGEETMIGE